MTTLEQLRHDFHEFYEGSPWFGDSYQEIIASIQPQQALALPPNGHSIARILWHMVKWRKALSERLLGNLDLQTAVSDADNWPDPAGIDKASWEAAKEEFAAQQTLIVLKLGTRDEAFLDEEFLPGKTWRWLATGVVQHDIYHLAQIALLKNF